MATPLRLEKYGRIDFALGRWATMGQNKQCISDMAGVDKRNRMARRSGGLECSPITLLLSDPGKPGVRSMGPDVCLSVRHKQTTRRL